MTALYLDSNAFVKLYTDENLSEAAQVEAALEKSSDLASSAITCAEVCGVFARQFQQGRMSEDLYWATRQAFEDNWEQVNIVEVSAAVSQIAADVLKAHQGLRAMDALHLASALALRQSTQIQFLTFDARLEAAAQKLMPDALLEASSTHTHAQLEEGGHAPMIFKLTLHKAYYEQGFFNITREFDHLIRPDEGEITISAGTQDTTFIGKVDRRANDNNTARIRAKGLKDWLQKNYSLLDVVEIEIVSPTLLKIKLPSTPPSS